MKEKEKEHCLLLDALFKKKIKNKVNAKMILKQ